MIGNIFFLIKTEKSCFKIAPEKRQILWQENVNRTPLLILLPIVMSNSKNLCVYIYLLRYAVYKRSFLNTARDRSSS